MFLRNSCTLGMVHSLNGPLNPFSKYYFQRVRGFSKMDSNNPFLPITNCNQKLPTSQFYMNFQSKLFLPELKKLDIPTSLRPFLSFQSTISDNVNNKK